MGQKKNKKILIILIAVIAVLILLAGLAFAYFSTDIFKSNKDLFFKYITQMGSEDESFIDSQLKEYFEKKKNTPYLDDGSLSVNIIAPSNQSLYEHTNNMNITFEGQVNKSNSQIVQNISLNYTDSEKFPFSYKKIENIVGLQTNNVGNKYIATNIDEFQELTNNNNIEKFQEFTDIEVSKQDLQHIQDTYFNILNQEIKDSNFGKIEEANTKGYKLTLTGEELKSILVKLLETLKNDQSTLDKINEYIKIQKNSLKITASNIDNAIIDINEDTELDDKTIEITVYQTKGKTTRTFYKSRWNGMQNRKSTNR